MESKKELFNAHEEESAFSVHRVQAGESIKLSYHNENKVIFVLKGKIITVDNLQKEVILSKGYMYALSRSFDTCMGIAFEDSIYVQLRTETIMIHADLYFVNYIRNHKGLETKEFAHLKINRLLKNFLANIVFMKNEKITSRALYDVKKQEFLIILRNTFDEQAIAQFFVTNILANSSFKITVLSHYDNSIKVKELADKCFMTTKTFNSHFKHEFGVTPHKWIAQKKILNLNDDIFNKSFSLPFILDRYGFLSKTDMRKFCQRYKLGHILELLDKKTA